MKPLFKPDPSHALTVERICDAKVGQPFSVELCDVRNTSGSCITAVCTLKVEKGEQLFVFDVRDALGHDLSYREARELVVQWVRQKSAPG